MPTNPYTGEPAHLALFNKGWIRVPESKVFETDPEQLDLEEVTKFIFSFLRRKPQTSHIEVSVPGLGTLRHYINRRFPRELQNILVEHLQPLGEKVHIEPISNAFQGCQPPEECWDWERLVRRLAQADAFEPGGCMQGAPLGLRNRRRIWRMLIEMKAPRGEWRTEGSVADEDGND